MKLLFDYGGVLVRLNKERCMRSFDALGFDIRPYIGTYAQRGLFSDMERGRIDVEQFCAALRREAGRPDLDDDDIVSAWADYLEFIPQERLDMLLRLHRHYRTYVLSNTNPVHWDMACHCFLAEDGHCVEDYFDGVFLSYELGVEKPEAAIFEAAIAGIGGPASDILFLDDSEVNCEAARRCGLQARLAPADGSWLDFFTADGYLRE
jgi:putative hydrolase of the HAD superfamily